MGELLLLLLVLAATALAVGWPYLERRADAPVDPPRPPDDDDANLVRHRLALEELRDLEADRRAGLLDAESYAARRNEAEVRATATLLTGRPPSAESPPTPARGGLRLGALVGLAIAALVLVGFALPHPVGIAERTQTNQALADAITAEEARQAEIGRLLTRLEANPRDPEVLSALADAYLAGGGPEDRRRGAVALIALLALEPDDASAYRRLITAYIDAGDWTDAGAALDSYEEIAGPDEPDIPFFRGLIALRGDRDEAAAVRHFDRFLELAPHDPRASMVLSLREQASGAE